MGKTKRAYMLSADVTIDPDEAIAEFEVANAEWQAHGLESVDESEVTREFRTLQDLTSQRGRTGYAVVPIDQMTPKQIRLVPAILSMFANGVCLRGTLVNPEPHFLVEADDDEPAAFSRKTPNLWFRYNNKL